MEYLSKISYLIKKIPYIKNTESLLNINNILFSDNLSGSLKRIVAINLFQSGYNVFLPHKDILSAKKTKSELELLGFENSSVIFSSNPSDIHIPTQEEVLNLLINNKFIIITTYESLLTPIQSKVSFEKKLYKLKTNQSIDYYELTEILEIYGYIKETFVEQKGDYSVRGSIVDVYSFSQPNPVRIEFDGNEINTLRLFDIYNQRSFNLVDEYSIYLGEDKDTSINEFQFIFEFIENTVTIAEEQEILQLKLNDLQYSKFLIQRPLDFGAKSDNNLKSNSRQIPFINSNLDILKNELIKLSENNYQIFIVAEQESHSNRIKDLLVEYSKEIEDAFDEGKIKFEVFPLQEGFILPEEKLALLCEHEIFNRPFNIKSNYKKGVKGSPKKLINNIQKGDFVVHSDYGIGMFIGLEKIKLNDYPQEVMKIEYDNKDIVYVNVNYLNKVQKYIAKENATPNLSKLGSSEWKTTKQKIKKKIEESVKELIRLYSERKSSAGFQFSKDTIWQRELESNFYYEDTPDQIKVTDEIKADMESPNPMDRLVCGDVGFGKTEVAVRAAFKSVMDSKQVAVLVPTTILAEQHYNTFLDRLGKYPTKIRVLSRFIKKNVQKETLKELEEGKVDILIGTHRILSKDVKFKDIGLLIIDEEQRFGVMAKEKIRQLKINVDTLYLTATPIPRTLNMALAGSKDVSIIATPPLNRLPIITEISKFDIDKIRNVITTEMGRSGQVFFVHDRVKSIDKMAEYIKKQVPEAKICIGHGQMKADTLETILHDFLQKKYDVLICTKIIESGLDIPNANTIIINRADRFGLAELYQLRGRVGRTNKQAYAYLFVPSLNALTKTAIQRLQAFEEFAEIGSGFNLSMRDLEIRGSGNLLGTEQSGFINSIGFDLYLKILEETVSEVKEKDFKDLFKDKIKPSSLLTDTIIDVYLDYDIPVYYIESQDERLNYYTKIFNTYQLTEIDDLSYEIRDKYGAMPLSVEILLDMAKLKLLSSNAGFEKIEIGKSKTILTFPKRTHTIYYDNHFNKVLNLIWNNYKNTVKLIESKEQLKLKIEIEYKKYFEISDFLKSFFKETTRIINEKTN